MHTEVILTKNVRGLGAEGDKVSVAPGYARNFLIPRGIATLATAASIRQIESLKKKRAEREAAEKAAAEETAGKISRLDCKIEVKTGQQDKMFGVVTAGHIHDFLATQGIEVDRKQIALEKPIHQVGEYHITINLAQGVTAHLKLSVVATEPPPAAATERRPPRPGERDRRPPKKRADSKAQDRKSGKSR